MSSHQPVQTNPQPDPPPRPPEEDYRLRFVDPVRECALRCAVEIVRLDPDGDLFSVRQVIAVAREFEAYLEGGGPDALDNVVLTDPPAVLP